MIVFERRGAKRGSGRRAFRSDPIPAGAAPEPAPGPSRAPADPLEEFASKLSPRAHAPTTMRGCFDGSESAPPASNFTARMTALEAFTHAWTHHAGNFTQTEPASQKARARLRVHFDSEENEPYLMRNSCCSEDRGAAAGHQTTAFTHELRGRFLRLSCQNKIPQRQRAAGDTSASRRIATDACALKTRIITTESSFLLIIMEVMSKPNF